MSRTVPQGAPASRQPRFARRRSRCGRSLTERRLACGAASAASASSAASAATDCGDLVPALPLSAASAQYSGDTQQYACANKRSEARAAAKK